MRKETDELLNWYQNESKRTCASLGNESLDLAHMVLGMGSEISELLDAVDKDDTTGIGEEVADIWFYIANYCTFRDYRITGIYEDSIRINNLDEYVGYNISKIQDLIKKNIAYGRDINEREELNCLQKLFKSLGNTLDFHGISLKTILINNIDKLRIRYPEKFTQENALNRNLEEERKVLERN